MLSTPWITCLWPGLTELWVRGRWTGLLWALGFTVLLNMALVSKGVWPELGNVWVRSGIWYLVLGFWLVNAILVGIQLASGAWNSIDASIDQLFAEAQHAYLRGQSYQAEALILRLLRREPDDAEALLLLATLRRHGGDFEHARSVLARLEKLDAAGQWWFEIHREKQLLKDRESAVDHKPEEDLAVADSEDSEIIVEDEAALGEPSLPEAA